MNSDYAYLEGFTDELRARGKYSFSLKEVRDKFQQSDEAIKKAILRLKKKKEIAMIRHEFYVIVTPEYRVKGMPPPSLFISDLMRFLNKEYYIGLLNAAAYFGAAHQQPQSLAIITKKPSLRNINTNQLHINFYIKKEWGKKYLHQRKVDTGYIWISSPELTALDLVNYAEHAGGLSRVATVLEELAESIAIDKLRDLIQHYTPIATIQRLGYILEDVLGLSDIGIALKEYLQSVKYFPILLHPQMDSPNMITGNEWKVVPNIEIETDL